MKYASKLVFSPVESMTGGGVDIEPVKKPANVIKRYARERQHKFLKIILRLAAINGYDEEGRIKLADGTYMSQSDIVALLQHALSPGRNISGMNEFIALLREAKVSPDLLINETVKSMLLGHSNQKVQKAPEIPQKAPEIKYSSPIPTPVPSPDPTPVKQPPKRRAEPVEDEPEEKRPREMPVLEPMKPYRRPLSSDYGAPPQLSRPAKRPRLEDDKSSEWETLPQ